MHSHIRTHTHTHTHTHSHTHTYTHPHTHKQTNTNSLTHTQVISLAPLSPMMPSNATLLGMTEKEFDHVLDKWTDLAQSPLYVSGDAIQDGKERAASPLFSLDDVIS